MKYKVDNVKNYSQTNGWICGQFFPDDSLLQNPNLEVKYSTLLPGDKHKIHFHPVGTEISIIIKGHVRYLVEDQEYLLKDGDFVFMYENIKEAVLEVYEPTTMISIRTPSIADNKVICEE
jgi:quercetin dioxygenase-like cupin family protein